MKKKKVRSFSISDEVYAWLYIEAVGLGVSLSNVLEGILAERYGVKKGKGDRGYRVKRGLQNS
ncbi:MAG: hypothetical protein LC109_12460 [Bacteroidia bacterium]|nr:hypothetical protein [Bacteroidia bacterium]